MTREDDFNADAIQRRLIERRKHEMLTEQRRPGVVQYQQQNQRGPNFDPRLDTKMTFDSAGNPMSVNGKPVAEIEAQKNAMLAQKLGLEMTPEAIQKAKAYHEKVLRTYKVGVPAHLQMYGINEWAPVTEVAKYGNMIDLGDEAGQAVQQQVQHLREYSERKWGRPEDTDTVMRNLNPQQQQVASNMISGLAQGKVKFMHEVPGANSAARPPLLTEDGRHHMPQVNQQHNNVPSSQIREGAHILSILQTGGWPTPCPLSKIIGQYNSAVHGMLIPTGRTAKTFIVQNENVRVDPSVIQQNPHFIKEIVEVADSRGSRYYILRESLQAQQVAQNAMMPSAPNPNRFINDQKRMAPTPMANQPSPTGIGTNQNFQQFMQKKILKG